MAKYTIIGSGALGTALGKVIMNKENRDLVIYGVDENEIKDLKNGLNTKYFPKYIDLPNFKTTTNLKEALKDCEYLILAVPSKIIPIIFENIKNNIKNIKPLIISGSKGFFPGTKESLHRGIEKYITENKMEFRGIVSLAGPSFAIEIAKEQPTIICAIGSDKQLLSEVQDKFQTKYLKIYKQTDIDGADVGSSFKNILAIGVGMAVELGYGINTIAGFLTRGINEMITYVKETKGKEKTLMGLTGVGDLILTTMSDFSRNRTFGRNFIKNGKEKSNKNNTVEGLEAIKFVYEIAKEKGIHLPIVTSLYQVLFKNLPPEKLINKLLYKTDKQE
ncbi:MAG: NAD(P)H-dependent glycerol-3-phosphate dehydrogenase [Mycoplasma sp.]|nr:NAD(P)H-dependent glycerol-3-phosphate dehydrogenase [Mycoplasma sp.]